MINLGAALRAAKDGLTEFERPKASTIKTIFVSGILQCIKLFLMPNIGGHVDMIILLIEPFRNTPVVSIEENEQGRALKFLEDKFKKELEITGITLSKKKNGVWCIFPDGDPKVFLEAFETDLFSHGLIQQGYYWIQQENYNDKQKWLEGIVRSVISAT